MGLITRGAQRTNETVQVSVQVCHRGRTRRHPSGNRSATEPRSDSDHAAAGRGPRCCSSSSTRSRCRTSASPRSTRNTCRRTNTRHNSPQRRFRWASVGSTRPPFSTAAWRGGREGRSSRHSAPRCRNGAKRRLLRTAAAHILRQRDLRQQQPRFVPRCRLGRAAPDRGSVATSPNLRFWPAAVAPPAA